MVDRATSAYLDYRHWFDEVSRTAAVALSRAALTMIANYDLADGTLTDHDYEQRLVFIMSANLNALTEELRK
jgi:hypothetical protein